MNKPVYKARYTLTVDLIRAVPDRRFKSGYRELTTVSQQHIDLQPGLTQSFYQQHIHKDEHRPKVYITSGNVRVDARKDEMDL